MLAFILRRLLQSGGHRGGGGDRVGGDVVRVAALVLAPQRKIRSGEIR